jgi:hypothetical protein
MATAHKSRTGLRFLIGNGVTLQPPGARLPVSSLAPSSSDAGHGTFEIFWDDTWDYGTYPTRICADTAKVIAESKEGNNCKKTHEIYVIPYGLHGSINGSSVKPLALPGVTLSWGFPAGVTFQLQPYFSEPLANEGWLDYPFLDPQPDVPDLGYTISGTNTLDGCSWEGGGGYEPSQLFDYIEMRFGQGAATYYVSPRVVDSAFHFPATVTCSGVSNLVDVYPADWGTAAWWFKIGTSRAFPDPGLTRLEGTYTDENTTWSWELLPTDFSTP